MSLHELGLKRSNNCLCGYWKFYMVSKQLFQWLLELIQKVSQKLPLQLTGHKYIQSSENCGYLSSFNSILSNWRVSEASETLSGVTQLKIGDIRLFIMCGHTYFILYFDPRIFVFASWSIPSHTSTKQSLFI